MKKHRIFSAVVSMLMSFSFLSVMLLSDYELKATADNYESAWFPVNQVRLTQLSFESASHSYSYHIDCVGSQAVGSDYAFAPFTGKIVYLDPSWGYCGLMSTDANGNPRPVHWADGSTDVMVV